MSIYIMNRLDYVGAGLRDDVNQFSLGSVMTTSGVLQPISTVPIITVL